MKENIQRHKWKIIIAVIFIVIIVVFSSPIRAMKICALMHGCKWDDVKNAKFKVVEEINFMATKYYAVCADGTELKGRGGWPCDYFQVMDFFIIKYPARSGF